MPSHSTIITTRYSLDRETWATLQKLISRMQVQSPTLPNLPRQFSKNKWTLKAIDSLFQVVGSLDGKQNKLWDNRNQRYDRDIVSQIVAIEARIFALGY
jgi:hypothetical protein